MKLKIHFTFVVLFCAAALPVFAAENGGDKLLDACTWISSALAADDLESAQKAAAELAAVAGDGHHELANEAEAVSQSDSLETAREKFRPLSQDAVKLAQGKEGYFVMTCPMADGEWVQKDRQVANPYYGASMLRCGRMKEN